MKNYFATVPTIVPTMNRMQNEMTEDESENLKKSNKKVISAHGGIMLCMFSTIFPRLEAIYLLERYVLC